MVADVYGGMERDDVASRLEMEFFDRVQTSRVTIFETNIRWPGNRLRSGAAAPGVQPGVQRPVNLRVAGTKRERQRLERLNELLRPSLLVQIVLEAPALESAPFVREYGDDVPRFDADVALGCVAGYRLGDWLRRCRRRCGFGRSDRHVRRAGRLHR